MTEDNEDVENQRWIDEVSEASVFTCGPSTKSCKCQCPDSCGHVWDGPIVHSEDGTWGSTTCSKCGMTNMDHGMWTSP